MNSNWRFPSRDYQAPGRSAVLGAQGAAATSHSLASLTAIEILKEGGNALDAAIAASGVLAVVEQAMTGIGGDCFVLIARPGEDTPIAYNGAGRSGATAKLDWFLERGIREIGDDDIHAVTVPGAVDAWCRLAQDHGKLGIERLLKPAIQFAEGGYIVAPRVAQDWAKAQPRLARDADCARWLLKQGRAPAPGDRMALPNLAKTLREIGAKGRDGFYRGWVAEDIAAKLAAEGSHVTLSDLAGHRGSYVMPIKARYQGLDVWECPPPSQGLTALLMLNLLTALDHPGSAPLSPERLHAQIEITKFAYRERDRHIADPLFSDVPVDRLLSMEFATELARDIDLARASPLHAAEALPEHRDTIYLSVVDRDRMAVSFINSLYDPFGSARLAPECGVVLQNRGACFVVEPEHPNCIGPAKQSMHTMIPAMACAGARPIFCFAVMGAHYQPVGQVHVLENMAKFGLDPQAALDCPRLFHEDGIVRAETGMPEAAFSELARLGHRIERSRSPLGGGQIVAVDWERGCLIAGSDPRKDGCALAY